MDTWLIMFFIGIDCFVLGMFFGIFLVEANDSFHRPGIK